MTSPSSPQEDARKLAAFLTELFQRQTGDNDNEVCAAVPDDPSVIIDGEFDFVEIANALLSHPLGERGEALEEVLIFCRKVAADLHDHAERAKAEFRDQDMYRANTAWHNVTGIIEWVSALKGHDTSAPAVASPMPSTAGSPDAAMEPSEAMLDAAQRACPEIGRHYLRIIYRSMAALTPSKGER